VLAPEIRPFLNVLRGLRLELELLYQEFDLPDGVHLAVLATRDDIVFLQAFWLLKFLQLQTPPQTDAAVDDVRLLFDPVSQVSKV
jgi:hypothetical protein